MSNSPPNSTATGPGLPGESPARRDARPLFQAYYESLPELPRGKLEVDVSAVEARSGILAGYRREELIAIARETRAALRQVRSQAPEPNDEPPAMSSPKWEKWLTSIGFGVFILA